MPNSKKVGDRFYRLVISSRLGTTQRGEPIWSCECDCGEKTKVLSSNLGRGVKSCGCLRREAKGAPVTPLETRLWRKTIIDDVSGCFVWLGSTNEKGYGYIWDLDRHAPVTTHKAGWELKNGPVPDDLNVCHECDNPPCWNPYHLFLGTQADNIEDMMAKGRHYSFSRTHCRYGHPLTEETTVLVVCGDRSYRRCMECRRRTARESTRRYRDKKREAVHA